MMVIQGLYWHLILIKLYLSNLAKLKSKLCNVVGSKRGLLRILFIAVLFQGRRCASP